MRQRTSLSFIALALLGLSACTQDLWSSKQPPPSAKPSPQKTVKTTYEPEAFIEHLTLARLALDANPTDAESVAPHVDVLNGYMAQRPARLKRQAVLVLDYAPKDSGDRRQVIAPISIELYNTKFPALLHIMQRLGETPHVLHEVSTATTSIVPTDSVISPGSSMDDIRIALEQQHQWLITNGTPISSLQDVQTHLQLIDFCMEHRFRDAAYLLVDNAKHLLAEASRTQPGDAEKIRILSKKLEILEDRLHRLMPYTLTGG